MTKKVHNIFLNFEIDQRAALYIIKKRGKKETTEK